MKRTYVHLVTLALVGAWATLAVGCTDTLEKLIAPNQDPFFLKVGKCQQVSPLYIGGVVDSDVASLVYGNLKAVQVCCDKPGTATITTSNLNNPMPMTVTCEGKCPKKPGKSMAPLHSEDIATPPILEAAVQDPKCHDQGAS